MTIPDVKRSPKNVPSSGGRIGKGSQGASAQPKICRELAAIDSLCPIGAGQSPARQNAGKTGSGGCNNDAAESEDSVTKCDRMSSKDKTLTHKGRGSGQGERKTGIYAPRQARWTNTPAQAPRKQRLMLKGTLHETGKTPERQHSKRPESKHFRQPKRRARAEKR